VVHTDPLVGVSHREERGSLERLRENLEVGGCCDKSLKVKTADAEATYICPVGSNFVFLDIVEWPLEP